MPLAFFLVRRFLVLWLLGRELGLVFVGELVGFVDIEELLRLHCHSFVVCLRLASIRLGAHHFAINWLRFGPARGREFRQRFKPVRFLLYEKHDKLNNFSFPDEVLIDQFLNFDSLVASLRVSQFLCLLTRNFLRYSFFHVFLILYLFVLIPCNFVANSSLLCFVPSSIFYSLLSQSPQTLQIFCCLLSLRSFSISFHFFVIQLLIHLCLSLLSCSRFLGLPCLFFCPHFCLPGLIGFYSIYGSTLFGLSPKLFCPF